MTESKILFAAGLGSTGSSALVDLLKEVEGFESHDEEFRLLVDPDGIFSLRTALTDNWTIFQSDLALKRYQKLVKQVTRKYIGTYYRLNLSERYDDYLEKRSRELVIKLTEIEYNGLWYGINNIYYAFMIRSNFIFNSIFSRKFFNSKRIIVGKNYSDSVDVLDKIFGDYIKDLVAYTLEKSGNNMFCFNENFSAMYPEKLFKILPDSKMVLVIRDPRDVYADGMKNRWLVIPDSIDKFIQWQSSVYNGWLKIDDRFNDKNRLLVVKFEDLVLDYENIKKKIFTFLDISPDKHINKFKYFDPQVSKKNIGQWKNRISIEESEAINLSLKEFILKYDY